MALTLRIPEPIVSRLHFLYHVAPSSAIQSIAQHGLNPAFKDLGGLHGDMRRAKTHFYTSFKDIPSGLAFRCRMGTEQVHVIRVPIGYLPSRILDYDIEEPRTMQRVQMEATHEDALSKGAAVVSYDLIPPEALTMRVFQASPEMMRGLRNNSMTIDALSHLYADIPAYDAQANAESYRLSTAYSLSMATLNEALRKVHSEPDSSAKEERLERLEDVRGYIMGALEGAHNRIAGVAPNGHYVHEAHYPSLDLGGYNREFCRGYWSGFFVEETTAQQLQPFAPPDYPILADLQVW
jgi:hypothetical protein